MIFFALILDVAQQKGIWRYVYPTIHACDVNMLVSLQVYMEDR